jgi:Copper binding periplasmic protein CusF
MARSRRLAVPLLFVLLLAGFAAGIWGSYRDVYPGRGLFRVTGVFEGRGSDTLILVSHDAAPGVMDEMSRMAFYAETKEMLDGAGLRRGDRVRLTVRQLPDRYLVVEIRKIQ